MIAFLACLKAGIVAVPVFPPNPLRRDTLSMFSRIVADCQARYALTNKEYNHAKTASAIREKLTQWGTAKRSSGISPATWPEDLKWIVTEDSTKSTRPPTSPLLSTTNIARSKIAFLQYTSGSTSAPKGVVITHGNLAHNLTNITAQLYATDDTVVVSWLPQYHDMGLIGSYLGVLYCGGVGYYLSPLSFLQRPMLWIEAISLYRATHLQAPNFAFHLTARKFQPPTSTPANQLPLRLESVRHVINAAEPVDENSMEKFCQTFAPYGFRSEVLYPTYGLAEHTVFVCSNGKQRLTVDKQELEINNRVVILASDDAQVSSSRLMGCGVPPPTIQLVIVDPQSLEKVEEDVVGEIWVSSESKAAGYYEKPEETKLNFEAQLANSTTDNPGGFLRTGDLGFLHQQEVFICGRLKDLIIVGGRNYYPQDIEATAEEAGGDMVRLGCSAAFTIDPTQQGDEEVALIMELKETTIQSSVCADLAKLIKGAINQEHSLAIMELVFLKPRTIPKTSSGKIARAWCRKAYISQTMEAMYRQSFKRGSTQPFEIEDDRSKIESEGKPTASLSVSEIRAMSKEAIMHKLIGDVARVASIEPQSIEKGAALVTMMDSLTITQFKGMFENSYAVKISDEYMFRESTTMTKLVEIVKLGYAPDDGEDGAGSAQHAVDSGMGHAKGLAGWLGCPPGVKCVIL